MARSGSIMAADFGNVTTRVVLFDIVDNEYRMVARGESLTTLGAPFDDVTIGLKRIVRDMGVAMNRTFLDKNGHIITPEGADRSGVDTFITTASAGRPLRAVLIGLLPDVSLRSAFRAIGGAYLEVVGTLTLEGHPSEEDQLNAVLLNRPDLIFIVGGTDGGAKTALLGLLKGVRLAIRVTEGQSRPLVVFAGNSKIAGAVQELFSDLTQFFVASNVMPTMDDESLEPAQLELGKAYDAYKERFSEGFSDIGAMSATGVLPTAQSYTLLAEYFAEIEEGNVLAVDMGSAVTVLVGVLDGKSFTRISTQHGLGHSAKVLLDTIGTEAVKQWIPAYISDAELQNYAINKSLRPATIPMTLREMYIEHALLRAGLRHLVNDAKSAWQENPDAPLPSVKTIIAGGAGLTKTGNPAYNLLLIADTLQPHGVSDVYCDPHGMVPALGALAQVNPEATIQLLDANNLEHLGTLISISGKVRYDKVIAKIQIRTEDERVRTDLKGGHLLILPIPEGTSLEIDIRLQSGYTINGKNRFKKKVMGGSAGILIDARGRDFDAGDTVQERARNLPQWVQETTDEELIPTPEAWLEPLPEVNDLANLTMTETPTEKPRRGGLFGRGGNPKPQKTVETTFDTMPEEEDFFALIDDEPQKPAKGKATDGKKGQPVPPLDDDDDLRKLL